MNIKCNGETIEVELPAAGRTLQAIDLGPASRVHAQVIIAMSSFFLSIVPLFRSLMSLVSGKPSEAPQILGHNVAEMIPDETPKEELRPPSPSPDLSQPDVFSSLLWRLQELEEKVGSLSSRPLKMPFDKEELLNAAACRVDALEAELIATKKVFSNSWNLIHIHNHKLFPSLGRSFSSFSFFIPVSFSHQVNKN